MSNIPEQPSRVLISPRGPVDLTLSVPGSKSITNRAVLVAALAQGETRLEGAP